MPFLSIVTPMFNRAAFVGRAVDSCLWQDEGDWELIVVDDGSTDGSARVVRRYSDPRIKLLKHERNRGVSPARNTGVRAAQGKWVLFLDSDDELLPGALRTVVRRANDVEDGIARLAFMYRLDRGGLSPEPPLSEETWTYEDYIRWSAAVRRRSDVSNCIRRDTFETIPFVEDRSFESLYHLDFAHRFNTRTFPDVIATVHSDAGNRGTTYSVRSLLSCASDNARSQRTLLERHGTALRRVAPSRWRRELRAAAILHFLAKDRRQGSRYALRLLREQQTFEVVALWALGLLGRRAVAAAMVYSHRRQRFPSPAGSPVARNAAGGTQADGSPGPVDGGAGGARPAAAG